MARGGVVGLWFVSTFVEQAVDVVEVVEGVVDEELQLGYDAELVAHACAEFVAHLPGVGVDVVEYFVGALRGEYAQVAAGYAEVGTYAHGAY